MNTENINKLLGAWLQGIRPDISVTDPDSINRILDLAYWHGISPLLYHQITNSVDRSPVPETIQKSLMTAYHHAVVWTMCSENELKNVYRLLTENSVEYLIFKGTPLSLTLYPAPYLRTRNDTDILFPNENTALNAMRLLADSGYTRASAVSGNFISQAFTCYKSSSAGLNHVLDMHWKISNFIPLAGIFSFDEVKDKALSIDTEGSPLYPSPVYSLILACVHRVAHIPYGESNRLIWLYDIHLLCNCFTESDWNEFIRICLDKKLAAVVLDSLQNTGLFLNTTIPKKIITQLEKHIDNSCYKPDYHKGLFMYQLDNLRTCPDWSSRLAFIKENLFPPANYMFSKYGISHPVTLPFLYTARILMGVPKLISKQKKIN